MISTPVIEVPLDNDKDERNARIIKGKIERTSLGQVAKSIKQVYGCDRCYVAVKLDMKCIQDLQLNLSVKIVRKAILDDPKLKVKDKHIQVRGRDKLFISANHDEKSTESLHFALISLTQLLKNVSVVGIPTIKRAVIQTVEKKGCVPSTRYALNVPSCRFWLNQPTNNASSQLELPRSWTMKRA